MEAAESYDEWLRAAAALDEIQAPHPGPALASPAPPSPPPVDPRPCSHQATHAGPPAPAAAILVEDIRARAKPPPPRFRCQVQQPRPALRRTLERSPIGSLDVKEAGVP